MTCTCQMCGQALFGGMSAITLTVPATLEEDQKSRAVGDIADFDLLAARVAQHINEHHRRQAQEMSAVMFLAGKVYAMTYAESSTEPNFKKLRVSWRKAIMSQLFEGRDDDDQAAVEAPAAGSAAAPAGEASNEKKSVRNASI